MQLLFLGSRSTMKVNGFRRCQGMLFQQQTTETRLMENEKKKKKKPLWQRSRLKGVLFIQTGNHDNSKERKVQVKRMGRLRSQRENLHRDPVVVPYLAPLKISKCRSACV